MEGAIPEYERMRKKNIEVNNQKFWELSLTPIATSNFKRPQDPGYVTLNPKAYNGPATARVAGQQTAYEFSNFYDTLHS